MPKELILFLAANPTDSARIALDRECAAVEDELRALVEAGALSFAAKGAVTVDKMMLHLGMLKPTVIHFAGHGVHADCTDSNAGYRDIDARSDHDGSGIYLQGDGERGMIVGAHALKRIVASTAASARLIVLNACYSEELAAQICEVVDCVVGMSDRIPDDAARSFAVAFYRALGTGSSASNAMEQARAALAAKHRGCESLPRCCTRQGVNANNVFLHGRNARLTPAPPIVPWPKRLEAVARMSLEARERLEADPWGSAMRAQYAIEHIADYLHERELVRTEPGDKLEAKLKRLEAKLVFPQIVADQFDTVRKHARSIIDTGGMADAPRPSLLRPCIDSLANAVEWFFRDYMKVPAPSLARPPGETVLPDALPVPDDTPNSTVGTAIDAGTHISTEIGATTKIWRVPRTASTLRLDAPEGVGGDQRLFRIEEPGRTYFIGRTEERSDHRRNDFAVPLEWTSISHDQGTLLLCDGGAVFTNTSSKDNVFVRGELVASGASRVLRHGDLVQFGRSVGVFWDGHFYPTAPGTAVDRRTGLLSRIGMITEISRVLKHQQSSVLFVLRCPEDATSAEGGARSRDPERVAAAAALAIHRHDPELRVARIGMDIAVLLDWMDPVDDIASVAARVVGAPCASGFLNLSGTPNQAMARLEACLSALSRLTIAGRIVAGPRDLARYALTLMPIEAFADQVSPLFMRGGGAGLFVLGELERLVQLVPNAVPVLELELAEMLGGRMGPYDLISYGGRGLLLFGMAGDVERFAQEVSVAWHARGPVTADAIEIDRSLSTHLLTTADLDNLRDRVASLARGDTILGASGLPAPLALAARTVNETHDPIERARALVRLAEITWQLLAFVLQANARTSSHCRDVGALHARNAWPAPWRALARAAAQSPGGQRSRIQDLATVAMADGGAMRAATDVVSEVARLLEGSSASPAEIARILPRLERAVREMLTGLGPLRGWTLIAILGTEIHDDGPGNSQRVEYVDYTGPTARGFRQRITLTDYPRLKCFTYLVRWNEGLAIALEPYARRTLNPVSGDRELFLANDAISAPGDHRYRSVASALELELPVTPKQLGHPYTVEV